MSKLTLTGTVSFETTFVVDTAVIEGAVQDLIKATEDPKFKELPAKSQVFTKLIVESYNKEGIEGATREMVRLQVRTGLNELLATELAGQQEGLNVRISPVKMVLETAQKVHNAQSEANA